jgi:hypothetical protein
MTEAELLELKQLLAPGILKVPGVSGWGIGNGRLSVYLESDNRQIREAVERTAGALAQGAPLEFVVTGPFRPQGKP